jgi:magnesium-transporting ATPase (P-type)
MAPLGVDVDDPSMVSARTVLFYLFVFCELTLALTCRSLKYTILEARPHRLLVGSIVFNVVLTIVLFGFVPGAAEAFGIGPLSLMGIEIIIGLCLISLVAIEGLKLITRRKENNETNRLNRMMTIDS